MTGDEDHAVRRGSLTRPSWRSRALIEVWLLTAVVTALRVLAAFGVNKIIAFRFGPPGLAVLGTFQNFTGLAIVIGGAGIGQGTVALLARASDHLRQAQVVTASSGVVLTATVPVAVAILVSSRTLSLWLFGTPEFQLSVATFALLLIPVNLGMSYMNVAAGFGQRRVYLGSLLLVGLATLAVVLPLIWEFRLNGALLAAQVASLLPFALLPIGFMREGRLRPADLLPRLDRGVVREFMPYPPMAFSTALVLPLVQLSVRSRISATLGVDAAGIWQGLVKVTESYMMMVAYLLVLVLIPKYSTISPDRLRRSAIRDAAIVGLFVGVLAGGIWMLRDLIIDLALSPRFRQMADWMPSYLLGDVVRSAGLVLGAALLARGRVLRFLAAEFAFGATYLGATTLLIAPMGVIGATTAYLLAASVGTATSVLLLKGAS